MDLAKVIEGDLDWVKSANIPKYSMWKLYEICSKEGHLDILSYLHSINNNIFLCESYIENVAKYGHLNILVWMYNIGCNLWYNSDNIIGIAAKNGHFACVKFFYKIGFSLKEIANKISKEAAKNKHIRLLKFLYMVGEFTPEYLLSIDVLRDDNLEVVKWLISLGMKFKLDKDTLIKNAASRNYFKIVKLLYSFGIKIDKCDKYFFNMFSDKTLHIIKWLEEVRYVNGYTLHYGAVEKIIKRSIRTGSLNTLKWLYKKYLYWGSFTRIIVEESVKKKQYHIIMWASDVNHESISELPYDMYANLETAFYRTTKYIESLHKYNDEIKNSFLDYLWTHHEFDILRGALEELDDDYNTKHIVKKIMERRTRSFRISKLIDVKFQFV